MPFLRTPPSCPSLLLTTLPARPPARRRRRRAPQLIHTLRKIEVFKCLNIQQIQQLADIMTEVTYSSGEKIIMQGEVGDSFYVIRSGSCKKSSKKMVGSKALELVDGDYFGESALLIAESRR